MNKSDLVDALADSAGMTKADASRALDALFGSGGVIARALRLATTLLIACGGTELATGPTQEEEGGDNAPPPVGTIIAQDSIDIAVDPELTGTDFVVGRRFRGSLPSGIPSTAGRGSCWSCEISRTRTWSVSQGSSTSRAPAWW